MGSMSVQGEVVGYTLEGMATEGVLNLVALGRCQPLMVGEEGVTVHLSWAPLPAQPHLLFMPDYKIKNDKGSHGLTRSCVVKMRRSAASPLLFGHLDNLSALVIYAFGDALYAAVTSADAFDAPHLAPGLGLGHIISPVRHAVRKRRLLAAGTDSAPVIAGRPAKRNRALAVRSGPIAFVEATPPPEAGSDEESEEKGEYSASGSASGSALSSSSRPSSALSSSLSGEAEAASVSDSSDDGHGQSIAEIAITNKKFVPKRTLSGSLLVEMAFPSPLLAVEESNESGDESEYEPQSMSEEAAAEGMVKDEATAAGVDEGEDKDDAEDDAEAEDEDEAETGHAVVPEVTENVRRHRLPRPLMYMLAAGVRQKGPDAWLGKTKLVKLHSWAQKVSQLLDLLGIQAMGKTTVSVEAIKLAVSELSRAKLDKYPQHTTEVNASAVQVALVEWLTLSSADCEADVLLSVLKRLGAGGLFYCRPLVVNKLRTIQSSVTGKARAIENWSLSALGFAPAKGVGRMDEGGQQDVIVLDDDEPLGGSSSSVVAAPEGDGSSDDFMSDEAGSDSGRSGNESSVSESAPAAVASVGATSKTGKQDALERLHTSGRGLPQWIRFVITLLVKFRKREATMAHFESNIADVMTGLLKVASIGAVLGFPGCDVEQLNKSEVLSVAQAAYDVFPRRSCPRNPYSPLQQALFRWFQLHDEAPAFTKAAKKEASDEYTGERVVTDAYRQLGHIDVGLTLMPPKESVDPLEFRARHKVKNYDVLFAPFATTWLWMGDGKE
ncbi:uncharacterized protein AMSG_05233 [Thecamonas trahens ATCC 50062]|uniref:Uncharacterized protein n=1 Tax=Thecamonas trahens ATCC 50062 TaxID=461836 RepID=A0A0L0DA72_THETB|nr:hypothetical protein AMSG_05233 [Thecamonas trahens ATCC 50062]KNC49242.1 hypothetical protein AMSG_05233 [Thecamonas trahens ATCC 50062]|eukprot:XP_013757958.1 hypothetical protein AMSG_05233 [Thecamonas trahens ATCC 50062]